MKKANGSLVRLRIYIVCSSSKNFVASHLLSDANAICHLLKFNDHFIGYISAQKYTPIYIFIRRHEKDINTE